MRRTTVVGSIRKVFMKGPSVAKTRGRSVTDRVLAALDPVRAQTTREIARKAKTTVAVASAILDRLRKEGRAIRQAPWLLASKRGS